MSQEATLLAVLGEGRLTAAELAEKMGVSPANTRRLLSGVRKKGAVEKDEDGRWKLAGPKGPKSAGRGKPSPDAEAHGEALAKMLAGGPMRFEDIGRALGLDDVATKTLLQRELRHENVVRIGWARGARWGLPGSAPAPAAAPKAPKKVRFSKLDTDDPVVAALLEQRAAADDRHAREIARIDRMLAIAGER